MRGQQPDPGSLRQARMALRRQRPSSRRPSTGVVTAPTSRVIVYAHWAISSGTPNLCSIDGMKGGAYPLTTTAPTSAVEISNGTSNRGAPASRSLGAALTS